MESNRQYLAENIMKRDYEDDLVLLANTPAKDKYQRHNLEQAARGICFFVNSDKTLFMFYEQDSVVSPLSGQPLKLEDYFT